MIPAPPHPNEAARLRAVRDLDVLDSAPEDRFDRLTRLAQEMFDAPIALITVVDEERQWFKSAQGLGVTETPREQAFCAHAILQDDVFVVRDASLDPRFSDNPLVTGSPDIRFYAGAPLTTDDGQPIGTLCVIDTEPREWTAEQSESLRDLANVAAEEFTYTHMLNQQRALLSLNAVTALTHHDQREQLRTALHLGCEYLGLPIGIISRIDADDYEVLVQVSPDDMLADGQHFSVAHTYCELALEADDVVAIGHMGESPYAAHPCYEHFGLESYIGVATEVDGHRFGTVNFASPEPRSTRSFTSTEIDFVRVLSRWVAASLRRWQLDDKLTSQYQLADVIARAQSAFIDPQTRSAVFEGLLTDILGLTGCGYGFIGEVLTDADDQPYLKTRALSDIAWNDDTRRLYDENAAMGLEFRNLNTLFGRTISTGEVVIANDPYRDERRGGLPKEHPPMHSYLGLPVFRSGILVGMVGLANMPGGFTQEHVDYLQPVLATIGQMIDQSSLRQRHAEDQRTLSRLSMVASQMSNGVLITDIDGYIEWVNDGFTRMTGYTTDDLLGQRPRDVLHGDESDPETVAEIFAAMAERRSFQVELRAYAKSGKALWVELKSDPLYREDGSIEGFMVMTSDINERKRIDEMKTEFVSTVSHELRTPLTSISGSLGLVSMGVAGQLPERAKDMVAIAYKNSQRLARLIDDLLDMEKLVEGKVRLDMSICEIMPLIERAMADNHAYAEQFDVDLECRTRAPHTLVDVDPLRMHQVLSNLLSNAAKFSNPRSSVDVYADVADGMVRVQVVDHGRGIPDDFKPRIFEKFSQADASDSRERGGTGLGLAISKELIERMGGTIGFTSTEGQGSCFFFELPVTTRDFD